MDIIVSGATGGIGRCITNHAVMSQNIERIYCMYRNEEKMKDWDYVDHPKIMLIRQDAYRQEEELQLMQAINEKKPDNLAFVHTAFSIFPIKRAGTYLPEEIKDNVSVNVMNIVFIVNRLIQYKQNAGLRLKIINIDSGAADRPLEGWGLYSAAKAYTNMFLRSVQLENPDVKIISYEPGVVNTQMQEEIRKTDSHVFGQVELFREYYEKDMLHSPDEVARDLFIRFVENWDGTNFREGYKDS